jgi:hypothetical protein
MEELEPVRQLQWSLHGIFAEINLHSIVTKLSTTIHVFVHGLQSLNAMI